MKKSNKKFENSRNNIDHIFEKNLVNISDGLFDLQ